MPVLECVEPRWAVSAACQKWSTQQILPSKPRLGQHGRANSTGRAVQHPSMVPGFSRQCSTFPLTKRQQQIHQFYSFFREAQGHLSSQLKHQGKGAVGYLVWISSFQKMVASRGEPWNTCIKHTPMAKLIFHSITNGPPWKCNSETILTEEMCCLSQKVILLPSRFQSDLRTPLLSARSLYLKRTQQPRKICYVVSIFIVFITKGRICTIHHFEEKSS